MVLSKRCLKCLNVAEVEDSPLAACPKCGAVYAKMEARARAGQAASVAADAPRRAAAVDPARDFSETLRSESIYPTFRAVVQLCYLIGLVATILLLIGAVAAPFMTGRLWAALPGLAGAGIAFVLARLFKESALMMADAADALVRLAGRR